MRLGDDPREGSITNVIRLSAVESTGEGGWPREEDISSSSCLLSQKMILVGVDNKCNTFDGGGEYWRGKLAKGGG